MKFAEDVRCLVVCLVALGGARAGAADWPSEVGRYYQAGFTADKARQHVLSTIEAFDNRSLPFKELTYKQSGDVQLKSGRHLFIDTFVSVIPQGGSLVTVVGQDDSKENYASVQFELSYRGLLVLRDQKYFPNDPIVTKQYQKLPPNHSPIMEVNAVSLDGSEFPAGSSRRAVFNFEVAPVGGSSHPLKMQRVCQAADEFDASVVAEALAGRAVRIACDLFDEMGKSRDLHQEKIYLMAYGVALLSRVVTANFVADYKISEVRIAH